MCVICLDVVRGAMTPTEARKALNESSPPNDHLVEVERHIRIAESAQEFLEENSELMTKLAETEEKEKADSIPRGIDIKRFGY
jgi:hypothetical protein